MTAALAIEAPVRPGALAWRTHLAVLGGAVAALLLLFRRDAAHMVSIWWHDATFNHCLLILPIAAWLVWQRLPELRRLVPVAWPPGLLLAGAGAAAWLVGEAGTVAIARHLGLVLMVQGAILACLGPAVARGLAFPLFFLLFLVPAGEALVPPLQTLTAHLSMALLAVSGVPAHLEGIFITTPTGYFEVAEACAGVRFLVAMAAYGALVANLCFRSWRRRAAFMAAALLVPILANGVRAWGTIYIAHRTSVDFAVGFDHILYGGLFFGAVMVLIMAAAWPFFDRAPRDPFFDPARLQPTPPPARPLPAVAAGLAALALAPLLWSAAVLAAGARELPEHFAFPEIAGWTRLAPAEDWQPAFHGADRLHAARYRDAAGREVDLVLAAFAAQGEGRQLVGFGQAEAPGWVWSAPAPAPPGGAAARFASHGRQREVVTFHLVGDRLTGSRVAVKIETMKVRLIGGPQRAATLMVSAEAPAAGVSPRPALDAFLAALGPPRALVAQAAGD
jgi:exosortase A